MNEGDEVIEMEETTESTRTEVLVLLSVHMNGFDCKFEDVVGMAFRYATYRW